MKNLALALLLLSTASISQELILPGTVLPVQLNSTIRSSKAWPGQPISARLMQEVPLGNSTIRAGAKVTGHVISVQNSTDKSGAQISLRFDEVVVKHQRIPVVTSLRALASVMDVSDAQVPKSGPDRGTSEYAWTTDQIGGEYRSVNILLRGSTVVGQWVGAGAVGLPLSKLGTACRGEIDGNHRPQAFWLFSSDACGLYDLPNLDLVHAGRSDPVGEITLSSNHGKLILRGGSGLLLRVHRGK